MGGEGLFVGGCLVWQEGSVGCRGARASKSSREQIPSYLGMNRGVFWATLCPGGIVAPWGGRCELLVGAYCNSS